MRVTAIIFVRNPPQWGYPVQSVTLWPLIRLATRSRWNHVALLTDRDVVVEALGGGVGAALRGEWEGRAIRLTETIPANIDCPWLESTIGTRYDYASLLWWKIIKLVTGRWYGPVWERARKAVTCSELAAMVLGMPGPWDRTPQELYRFLTD